MEISRQVYVTPDETAMGDSKLGEMMQKGAIDTIRFATGALSEETVKAIKEKMVLRHSFNFDTGEEMYIVFSNTFSDNTHNRAITIKYEDKRWVRRYIPSINEIKTFKESCEPYIIIECSAHKVMMGHNLFGGSTDVRKCVNYIINDVSETLEIKRSAFGDVDEFEIYRLDYAINFKLTSATSYFENMRNSNYPRRRFTLYEDSCLYFPGTTTTLKFYDKFAEFKKHDYKKLRDIDLLEKTRNVLRVEIEVKRRKMKDLFDSLKVKDIDMGKIINLYNGEVKKVFECREIDEKKIVGDDVYKRLLERYGYDYAEKLYSSYNHLLNGGKKLLKRRRTERTYYRHLKMLKDAGIRWTGIKIEHSDEQKEFVNFVPLSGSKYAIN